MKSIILAALVILLAGCATTPTTPQSTLTLTFTPDVRKQSMASDRLFADLINAPNGVGYADVLSHPKAEVRSIEKIEVLVPVGDASGLERWTVSHGANDTAVYTVKLAPDGSAGTNFAVSYPMGGGIDTVLRHGNPDGPFTRVIKDKPAPVTADGVSRFEAAIAPYVAQGQRTYPEAKRRYLAGLPPKHQFSVLVRLTDDAGRFEIIFIRVHDIDPATGEIKGSISNTVNVVHGYHRGQILTLPESRVLDWTITRPDGSEEGNVVGNFLDNYR